MKILFACDLHGRKNLYERLFSYAHECKSEVIIIGGDLLPTLIPNPLKLISGGADFNSGLSIQLDFIESYLVPKMKAFVNAHPAVRILYVPGNHDWKVAVDHLVLLLPDASCMHCRTETIDGITFVGYGCVTDSPFWVKDFVRRDTRESWYVHSRYPLVSTTGGIIPSENGQYSLANPSIAEDLAYFGLSDPGNTICIFHCPPFGTGLDTLHDGKPIGSRSITNYIMEQKPGVSLHGHIHEAPYMSGTFSVKLGETISINPGYHFKELHAVTFDSYDPAATMAHRVFGDRAPKDSGLDRTADRCARSLKAFFMKTVLMKK
jgi:Icc-related predicted phosphoesterase